MAVFECSRCGLCCMNFGELIRIERGVSDIEFYCRFLVTNELFRARVMPEWREAFADTAEMDAHPAWCRFLRRVPGGTGFVCTIHDSNASICRDFRCCVMRIYNGSGTQVGKIGGNRSLFTEDEKLKEIYRERVMDLKAGDMKEWLAKSAGVFSSAGFRVVVYDEG
ncbi:MAG TPA: YkgJ family cysteine cluster protein [Methanomicrobiales archaeon]|jgi:Fe-S-cluster containining protein|nr:YkgJ family cysteine cluster protein [Methanomicrobiales archaeon]